MKISLELNFFIIWVFVGISLIEGFTMDLLTGEGKGWYIMLILVTYIMALYAAFTFFERLDKLQHEMRRREMEACAQFNAEKWDVDPVMGRKGE
jgi:hypothetical protein